MLYRYPQKFDFWQPLAYQYICPFKRKFNKKRDHFKMCGITLLEVAKDLRAARRKDLDEREYQGVVQQRSDQSRRDPPKQINRSQSAKTLVSSSMCLIAD